jgi:hypothetical protein
MRLMWRLGLPLAILLLCATGPARAQTNPVPPLPPEESAPDAPAVTGTRPEARSQPGTSGWVYSLGAGLGWESNAGLDQLSGGAPSDYVGLLSGQFGRQGRTANGSYGVAARVTGFGYAEQKQYDRADFGASLSGARRLSPSTTGSLGGSVAYGHTDNSTILSEQGLLLPLTRSIGYEAEMSVAHQSSPATTLTGSLRGYLIDFPESELQSGKSLRFSLDLARRVGARTTIGAAYEIERADVLGSTSVAESPGAYWSHYLSTHVGRVISPRTSLRFEAGASYTPNGEQSGLSSEYNFFGGVGLARQIKRSSLTAYFRREVLPAFGVGGLRVTDRLALDLSTPLGRSWETSLGASYSRGDSGAAEDESVQYADGEARLGRSLGARVWLVLAGSYRYQSAVATVPSLDNYRVGLFASFGSRGRSGTRLPRDY